jgi:hypothetical protein
MDECNLPNVKFENFAAAKAVLQKTYAPIGAIIKRLSIQQDQNGKAVWRACFSSTGTFPTPNISNFAVVRSRLNQCAPKRSVLRQ